MIYNKKSCQINYVSVTLKIDRLIRVKDTFGRISGYNLSITRICMILDARNKIVESSMFSLNKYPNVTNPAKIGMN